MKVTHEEESVSRLLFIELLHFKYRFGKENTLPGIDDAPLTIRLLRDTSY